MLKTKLRRFCKCLISSAVAIFSFSVVPHFASANVQSGSFWTGNTNYYCSSDTVVETLSADPGYAFTELSTGDFPIDMLGKPTSGTVSGAINITDQNGTLVFSKPFSYSYPANPLAYYGNQGIPYGDWFYINNFDFKPTTTITTAYIHLVTYGYTGYHQPEYRADVKWTESYSYPPFEYTMGHYAYTEADLLSQQTLSAAIGAQQAANQAASNTQSAVDAANNASTYASQALN